MGKLSQFGNIHSHTHTHTPHMYVCFIHTYRDIYKYIFKMGRHKKESQVGNGEFLTRPNES